MSLITDFRFKKASPVWLHREKKSMNISMSSVAKIGKDAATLYVAGASSYVVMVNGKFIAHGPARCAHGFYNVDEIDLSAHLTCDENFVAIRTAGYNTNSYSYVDVNPFICAEIVSFSKVIAYTDAFNKSTGFMHFRCNERLQKVQRYSFQRPFVENYNFTKGGFEYETAETEAPESRIQNCGSKSFICRDIPYGDYESLIPGIISRGKAVPTDKPVELNDRSRTGISPELQGFKIDELEDMSDVESARLELSEPTCCDENSKIVCISANEYANLEFERNYAGLFTFDVECDDTLLYFAFSEVLNEKGQVDELGFSCCNIIKWKLNAGTHRVVCAEPYTLKYLRIASIGGNAKITNLKLNKIAFPSSKIKCRYNGNDSAIKEIFDAAVETFAANTVDIYMDCPSRERAGWLCDSFFTSRVENILTGKSKVERAFLKNFLLVPEFEGLPKGMLPMCYPADHYDFSFIPNWAMWYVLELYEYYIRTGDKDFIEAAREKVYNLLEYFKPFENEYGLLEKLESWVFVEWSKANKLTQDVNFPTNMLYAAVKSVTHLMYGDKKLFDEASALRKMIKEMSMTESGFFCDNALRIDGKLVLSGERTEACQYYAFFFNIANEKDDYKLFKILIDDFGYERRKTKKYPEIHFANAFIGNYLRLDYICRLGMYDILVENIKSYFYYMAKTTGTLWEYEATGASCNHGFASHVIYWLDKAGMLDKE